MRRNRVLGVLETNYYHVVSRVVDRRFIFGGAEKRHFRHLMRRLLAFSGLRCVTFCLMDNHFHLLLEVPDGEGERFKEGATAEDVLGRVALLYEAEEMVGIRGWYEMLVKTGRDGVAAEEYLATFLDRMYDLSTFVKELKARFTVWHNRREGRRGTLWEERFKSVLCEGSREVLTAVAAYIDLNPVRASLAGDPKEYRWSGYGEAVAGEKISREGIMRAIEPGGGCDVSGRRWREMHAEYRMLLFGVGEERVDADGKRVRAGLSRAAVEKVLASGGTLSMAQALRCQVGYFSYGMAVGGREFLEAFFLAQRGRFGAKRKSVGCAMRGARWGGMMTLRGLRGGDSLKLPPPG